MSRRFASLCGALLVVTLACVGPSATTGPSGAAARPTTYDVQVDAKTPAFNIATITYFPNELKAHPGDTIRFTSIDRGEPHTVTFGTLVDEALAALAKLPKDAPPPFPPPPEVQRIPQFFVGQPPNIDVNPVAGQPCFLASGDPPKQQPCTKEQQKQTEFTGTQAFFNSGYMPDRAVFAVKLADGVKPGTYSFMCLFHGTFGMTGKVVVVDRSETLPGPEEAKAKGAEQLNTIVQGLRPAVERAAAKASPQGALASTGSPDVPLAEVTAFFPKVASIPAGGSVTWQINFGHTISFNAPPDASDFIVKAVDGSFHLNAKAVFASNSPDVPFPDPNAPPPPEPPPLHVDAGPWDGRGFRSSGFLEAFDPRADVTYTMAFTRPGTYTYQCLVHIDMEGTVKVGP